MPGNQQAPQGYWGRFTAAADWALRRTLFRVLDSRHWQMAASLGAGALAMYQTYLIIDEQDPEEAAGYAPMAVANLTLLTYAFLQHPGTIGDPQVPAANQRRVSAAMREAFSDDWSTMRWGLNAALLPALLLTGGPVGMYAGLNRFIAGGAGMLPYVVELSAVHARFYRANPAIHDVGARQNDYFKAGFIYYLVYLFHTFQGIAVTLNITYLLKLAEGIPKFPDTTFASTVYPHIAGVGINQICMAFLVTYQAGTLDSPANRVYYSGVPRVLARMLVRGQALNWESPERIVIFGAYDLVDTSSVLRWFQDMALKYRAGLTMDGAHAARNFGDMGNQSLLFQTIKPLRLISDAARRCMIPLRESWDYGQESKRVNVSGLRGSPAMARIQDAKFSPPRERDEETKSRGPRDGLRDLSSSVDSPASGRSFNPSPSSLFSSQTGAVPGIVVVVHQTAAIGSPPRFPPVYPSPAQPPRR